jgi:amphi-Trp domain-containing protein
MNTKEIKIEGKLELRLIIDYFSRIIEGLRTGKISIKKGQDIMTLNPEGLIEIQVEAKQKKDEEKYELKLKWKKGFLHNEDLKISSK